MTKCRVDGSLHGGRSNHGVVSKRYLGPDAPIRQHAEVTALRHLIDTLPVPTLLHDDVGQIGTALCPAVPGKSCWS